MYAYSQQAHTNFTNLIATFSSFFFGVWLALTLINMGLSEKAQVEGGIESDNRKWVIAGIALRAPLKPIYTTTTVPVVENSKEQKEEQVVEEAEAEAEAETEECSTTPTSVESRIPTTLTCPPAPRKRRPSSKCSYRGVVRELFTQVPDLETVFMRHVEKAS